MIKSIFATFSLVILFAACKKEDHDGNPYCHLGQKQNWTKYEGNPVFVKGQNSWDDGIILGHSVIKSGNTYKMWYSGGHGFPLNSKAIRIEYFIIQLQAEHGIVEVFRIHLHIKPRH